MALVGVECARGTVNRLASGAIAANLLVQTATVGNSIIVCGASGVPTGIAYDAIADAAFGDVSLITGGDRHLCTASAAIAIGDFVKAAAAGKVASDTTTATAGTIGVAESAATGDGITLFVRFA
jgi:hypothetical protein